MSPIQSPVLVMPANYGQDYKSNSCCSNLVKIFSRVVGGSAITIGGASGITGTVVLLKTKSPDWIGIALIVMGVVVVVAGVLACIKNPYSSIKKENDRLRTNNVALQANVLALNDQVHELKIVSENLQIQNDAFSARIKEFSETVGKTRSILKNTLSELNSAKNELVEYQALEKTIKDMFSELSPELVSIIKSFKESQKAAIEATEKAKEQASEIIENQKKDLNHIQELIVQLKEFKKDVEALKEISLTLATEEKELEESRHKITEQTTAMEKYVDANSSLVQREEGVTKNLDDLIVNLNSHLKELKKAKKALR